MNPKLVVEEDSQWKMFINMDNTTGTEWYHGRLLGQNGTINFEQNGIIKEVTIR
jgi:hypothetical protein